MLEIKNVYKTYSSKNGVTHRALENVSLKFNQKGLVFILGKSGSGKSTLLNLIGGIDNFDRGDIYFNGKNFLSFTEKDFDYYRNTCVGFVFQDFNLLDNLTVFENVSMALDLQSKKDNKLVLDMLKQMDVLHLKNRMINELSGGQRQRVSIARALIKNPKIILADEPTGSLDSETSDAIINILTELSKDRLVIVVTHNKEIAYEYGDRIIEIRDGFVLKDLMRRNENDSNDIKSTLVSSNLVIVPKNNTISDECLNDLNVSISEKRQDYFVLVEQDKRRAMSLYPNVSEVINDDNNEESFKPYHYEDYSVNENSDQVKSNLPLKKAFKFSLSNLKKKKLRLFFTILLAILSVILTGTAMNFTQYSFTKAVAGSIEKDNGSFIEVSSSFAINDGEYTFQNNDLNFLNSLDRTLAYEYNQSFQLSVRNEVVNRYLRNDYLFPKAAFSGLLICDSIEDYGYGSQNFKIIYKLDNIIESDYDDGVFISSVVANIIINYIKDYGPDGAPEIGELKTVEDLLGYSMSVNSSLTGTTRVKVLGIFDYDENMSLYNKYRSLYDNPDNIDIDKEYKNLSQSILLRIVAKPQFMDWFKNSLNNYKSNALIYDIYGGEYYSNSIYNLEKFNYHKYTDTTNSRSDVVFGDSSWNTSNIESKIASMKSNEIFVGWMAFKTLIRQTQLTWSDKELILKGIENFNKMNRVLNIQNSRGSNNEIFQSIKNVKIVGVFSTVATETQSIFISNSTFNELSNNYYRPSKVLIKAKSNENYISIIDKLYKNNFTIDNDFVKYFVQFASTIDKYSTLINVVAIIWLFVVALLLYSFISNSIKDSSKQIGILKALGANIKDIYKIYMFEALLIGILATIFGVFGFYFIGIVVNRIITSLFYTFYFPIFRFEFISVLVMVLSTFLILTISLIIALSRVKNIKPIDVMNTVN